MGQLFPSSHGVPFILIRKPENNLKTGEWGQKGFCMGYLSLQMGTLIFDRRRCGPHHHRPAQARLLIRLLEEVWFPGHACHALLASLFASLFAGKREATSADGGRVAQDGRGTLNAKQ